MMELRDIRDYVATLKIADDEHCYCGRLDDKKEKSIGVYPLKQRQSGRIPLGGMENASYALKRFHSWFIGICLQQSQKRPQRACRRHLNPVERNTLMDS